MIKKLFGKEKSITKAVVLLGMTVLMILAGALTAKSSQNPGDGWGYYMPWGYYASGYQYWNPNPVGGNHSNGTLIKGTTDPVYLLEVGAKRWVKSPTIMACRGWSFGSIVSVSNAERDGYANGPDLLCPSGTLIKGSAPAVYVVNESASNVYTRRHITSVEVFNSSGFNWNNIYNVSDTELAWYTAGPDLDETATIRANGSVIKTAYFPEVYVVDTGQKRWFYSPLALTSNNYSWSNIITVSLMELNNYTTGNPVRAAKGTLIKTSTSPRVYVVDLVGTTYYRRWITSSEAFTSKGYNWANVNTVSQTELDTFADALNITS